MALQSWYGDHCPHCRKRRQPATYWDHDCDFEATTRKVWEDTLQTSLKRAIGLFYEQHELFCRRRCRYRKHPHRFTGHGPMRTWPSEICQASGHLHVALLGHEYWTQPILELLVEWVDRILAEWAVWLDPWADQADSVGLSGVERMHTYLRKVGFINQAAIFAFTQYQAGHRGLPVPMETGA